MTDDTQIKTDKDVLRDEAKRARGLMSLSAEEQEALCAHFFERIAVSAGSVVGAYWPKGREVDTLLLVDALLERDVTVAFPVVQESNRILRFACWDHTTPMTKGAFGIAHPVIDNTTQWLNPDIFLVPLLAFDRRGYRLGYGGGYYDATLVHYRDEKDILAVGLAYAAQACLFPLPAEEHDVKLDWIITEQSALRF